MTYLEAKKIIIEKLKSIGWESSDLSLKTPWIRVPTRSKPKIYFKAQSIYRGYERPDLSLHVDTKKLSQYSAHAIANFIMEHVE